MEAARPALDALHASMRDVQEGDVYRLDYAPAWGMTLSLNERSLWRGSDARLAAMYFGIWLGESALSDDLRLALLGGRGSGD